MDKSKVEEPAVVERKLTKAQRATLALFVQMGEVSSPRLAHFGVRRNVLVRLQDAGLAMMATYANGHFWSITDTGRRALSQSGETL